MKKRLPSVVLLFLICFLTACPARQRNEFNHVIINQSKTILQVEYEYVFPKAQDNPELADLELADLAKMTLEKYESEDRNKQWSGLSPENEFKLESRSEMSDDEKSALDLEPDRESNLAIKKITLKLLPGEVLRVFNSGIFDITPQSYLGFSLRGENGRLETKGSGFYPFSAYRPDGFFTDTKDRRLVYR